MAKRVFTNSELSTYQDCPKKWWFKYNQKLSPDKVENRLFFGSLVHSGLGVYFSKDRNVGAMITHIEDEVKKAKKDLIDNTIIDELDDMQDLAVGMLTNYHNYSKDNDKFKVLEIEINYNVPVITDNQNESSKFDYNFTLDMLVEKKDGLWIKEYKTAAIIDRNYVENLALDNQIDRYSLGVSQLKNKQVKGVIYTVLRKKLPSKPKVLKDGSISSNKAIDTTYEIYYNELIKNEQDPTDPKYFEILEMLKARGNTFIFREEIKRTAKELEEVRRQLYTLCRVMSTNPPIYKCPSRDCSWKCAYRSLCIFDSPTIRRAFIVRKEHHPEVKKRDKNGKS